MIISTDAEKTFDKIQHPFTIKTLQKARIKGTYPNIIKAIYDKPTVNFPEVRKKTKMPSFISTTERRSASFRHSNQSRKIKGIDWKKRSKTLFADDMILYVENCLRFYQKTARANN